MLTVPVGPGARARSGIISEAATAAAVPTATQAAQRPAGLGLGVSTGPAGGSHGP